MSKAAKGKKDRVPKISEEESAAYLSALKSMTEGADGGDVSGGSSPAPGKKE